jgi:hypothetical protein
MKSAFGRIFVIVLILASVVLAQSNRNGKPLGEAPALSAVSPDMTQSARKQFLERDFTVLRDIRLLPPPVLEKFTERNGSRPVIANPGKDFIEGDVINDSSVPRERLIFAGVSREKCFVHYEQGGRAHTYLLVLFDVVGGNAKLLWRGYCSGVAANVSSLPSVCR